jgi:hypothetical protein
LRVTPSIGVGLDDLTPKRMSGSVFQVESHESKID